MPNFSKLLCSLIVMVTFASCAVAPLNSTNTARTLGEKVNQWKANIGVPGAMYERGLTENFDFGVGLEFQSAIVANLFGKYALINNKENGFSVAGLAGVGYGEGATGDSKSAYAGPVISLRYDWFEVFTVMRVNYVDWDNDISPDDRNDLLSFLPNKEEFWYGQVDLGVSYISDKTIASIGVKILGVEKDNSSAAPFFDIAFKF